MNVTSVHASAVEGRAPQDRAFSASSLYREMARIRAIEHGIARHYTDQEMRCPVHLSVGQDKPSAAGCLRPCGKSDYALSGHRSHSHYLAKGGDLKAHDGRNLRQGDGLRRAVRAARCI